MRRVTRAFQERLERQLSRDLRGVVWKEWRQHGPLVKSSLVVWAVGLWVLLAFPHPVCLLVTASVYAIFAGSRIAGSDQVEGCEEFTFALPPTRRQRFLARLAVGGVPLLVMVGVGVPAIRWEWPQALWGLVVQSGFTGPLVALRGSTHQVAWDLLTCAAPIALFSSTFSLCALAPSRDTVAYAWVISVPAVGALTAAGLVLERWLRNGAYGDVTATTLLLFAIAVSWLGCRAHHRKEGTAREAASWTVSWAATLTATVALLLLFGVFTAHREQELARSRYEADVQAMTRALEEPADASSARDLPAAGGSNGSRATGRDRKRRAHDGDVAPEVPTPSPKPSMDGGSDS